MKYDDNLLYYLVTICKHQVKEYVSKKDLDQIIKFVLSNDMFDPGIIHEVAYERHGVYKQLHCHLLMSARSTRRPWWPTSAYGFRVYYSPLKDLQDIPRVCNYIYKYANDYIQQEQILYENACAYHNMFK